MNYTPGHVFAPTENTRLWDRPYRDFERIATRRSHRVWIPLHQFDGKDTVTIVEYDRGRVVVKFGDVVGFLG